jgi:hypothetical protein
MHKTTIGSQSRPREFLIPRPRHQVRVVDTCAEAQDLIRRCQRQAEANRAEGQGAMAMVLDICRFEVSRQLDKMRESYWSAANEFGRWSGRLSAESNAERAARQAKAAESRADYREMRLMGYRSLIGKPVTVTVKKGN